MPRTTRSAQKTILSHKQQQEMRQKQAGVTFLEDDFDDTEEEDVLQTQMVLTMPDVQDADGNTKDDDAEDGEDDYVAPASAPASDMKNEQHSTPRTSISRTVSMTKKASQQGTSSGGTKQKLPPISSSSKESSVHETQQSPPWAWRQKKQQQQSASPAGGPMVVAPPTDRGRSSILATDPAGGPPPATGDPATVAASTAAAVDFPSAAKSPPPPPRNGSTSKLSSSSQNSPVPHTATTPRSIPQQKKNALGALQADVIEYVQELIFNQQEGRAANWALLEHLMKEYSGADNDRIFLRNKLCDLLFDACSEPGYNPTSLSGYNATEWNELLEDLETTRAACWRSVGKDVLLSAQDRDDPSNTVVERTDEDDMKEHREFGRRYNVLVIACKIHAKLAEIRPKLERQVRRGGSGPPDLNPTKVASLLDTIRFCDDVVIKEYVYSLFVPQCPDQDAGGHKHRSKIMAEPQPILKNLEELRTILNQKPFKLTWLQSRVESLVLAWKDFCFSAEPPTLVALGYEPGHRQPWKDDGTNQLNKQRSLTKRRSNGNAKNRLARQTTSLARQEEHLKLAGEQSSPPPVMTPEKQKDVDSLKRLREQLRDDHGEDPLETSRELAEQATGKDRATHHISKKLRNTSHQTTDGTHEGDDMPTVDDENDPSTVGENEGTRRALYGQNKNKTVLEFDDSDEGNEEDLQGDPARLTMLPAPSQVATDSVSAATAKTYVGPPPDEGIFDDQGNVLKRQPWQEEEVGALVAGLIKHGVGKWVQVKNEYGQLLRNRSSVQLKDKYRTMKRKGELPNDLM